MHYDAEEVASVFGRAAAVYDTVVPFFARFGTRLVEVADLRPGEAVLDVASGRGATLLPAAERVGPSGRVLGVDLSEAMVGALATEIERRRLTNASARRMNAEALELEAESFDVAIASFVLHLLPDPERATAELWRVLRRGGRVAAAVPTGAGEHWRFLMQLLAQFAPRAIRPVAVPFRSEFDVASVLASAGFEVVERVDEQIEFVFSDEQAWWDWAWSAGLRALFEVLSSPDLEELRQAAFREVAALRSRDGITLPQTANLVVAEKAT